MKNNWQKDIHDRLGNYEKDAPKGLWEDIRKGTTDENVVNDKTLHSLDLSKPTGYGAQRILQPLQAWLC